MPLANRLGKQLDVAAAQLEGDAIADPLGVARMQSALGWSMLGLGYPKQAIALLTKANATFTERLGPDHLDSLTSMSRLAYAYQGAGEFDRAVTLSEQVPGHRATKKFGPEERETISAMAKPRLRIPIRRPVRSVAAVVRADPRAGAEEAGGRPHGHSHIDE